MSARRMGIMLALGALLSLALAANALATHERPKGATPDNDPLVTAYEPCGSLGPPNRNHAIFGIPSCNPPVQDSDYLTSGSPDANGAPAKQVGVLRKVVVVGDPTTVADEADIAIHLSLTDVRCRPALATATPAVCANSNTADGEDYSGELNIKIKVNRISDHANGTGVVEGTTTDLAPLNVAVPCAATDPEDPTIGALCEVDTSLEAVYPGIVPEGERANWEFDRTIVEDGGSDGDVDTAGDGEDTFVEDGIYVP